MNFNMKNRIWKKLSVMSMAFFMTGMVLGGCGQTTVYAAEEAYEAVRQTGVPALKAGDMDTGASLVVMAIAGGKQAAAQVDAFLMGYTNIL